MLRAARLQHRHQRRNRRVRHKPIGAAELAAARRRSSRWGCVRCAASPRRSPCSPPSPAIADSQPSPQCPNGMREELWLSLIPKFSTINGTDG
jgi:hypothetical protein